jgi:hypothetical protein
MHDVQTYLEKQDREVLVRIVMQQAMEDERLRERLLLRASRAEGLDLAAFRRAVDDAVDFDDYLGSPWDYARGIQNVVGAIAELLEEGFAPEVVELSEYALARIEGAGLPARGHSQRKEGGERLPSVSSCRSFEVGGDIAVGGERRGCLARSEGGRLLR